MVLALGKRIKAHIVAATHRHNHTSENSYQWRSYSKGKQQAPGVHWSGENNPKSLLGAGRSEMFPASRQGPCGERVTQEAEPTWQRGRALSGEGAAKGLLP